jgi:pseudouridine kinase
MSSDAPPPILCIGGALIDRTYRLKAALTPATSNPAVVEVGFGGVARNVAENLARLGARTRLAAVIGDDATGDWLLAHLDRAGVDTTLLSRTIATTAEYAAILDGATGELHLAVVAMEEAEAAMDARLEAVLAAATADAILLADANLSAEALAVVRDHARATGAFLAVDAVSVAKSGRMKTPLDGVALIKAGADEAATILGTMAEPDALAAGLVRAGAGCALVTAGARGAWLADLAGVVHAAALPCRPVSVSGAGDALMAAVLWRMALGATARDALPWGLAAAAATTEASGSVHPDLSPAFLERRLSRKPAP